MSQPAGPVGPDARLRHEARRTIARSIKSMEKQGNKVVLHFDPRRQWAEDV